MPVPSPRKNGRLGVYVGGTRQGKGVSVKADLKRSKVKRVIVWSVKEVMDHYGALDLGVPVHYAQSLPQLLDLCRHLVGKGNALIVYMPGALSEFNGFCRIAFAWGKLKPCAIIGEELADVTSPAKAPEGWGIICRQALGYGIDIYAVTQRPAESDKTCFSNRSYIVIHNMERAGDRAYIVRETDIPRAQIDVLTHGSLRWVRKENGIITGGQHRF
jgi:hypothetical protein